MNLKKKFYLLSFFSLLGCTLSADQIPYVYTNGGPTQMTLRSCLSRAKEEMRLAKFTRNLQVVYDDDNSHSATIFSSHSYRPVGITYRCLTNINTRTWGIASLDNDEAWESYLYFNRKVRELYR